jgi:hypothetical protein
MFYIRLRPSTAIGCGTLSNSVRHKSCNSSARLFVGPSRKAVYERSHRSSQVFSGEQGAHVCSHLASSEQGRIPEAGVGTRWGHSNVQCSSSCNASGARHQGHALRDLGTLGLAWRRRSMSRWCEFVRNLIRLMSWLYGMLVARIQEAGLQCECRKSIGSANHAW